jgi:hypothetical protein
MGKSKNKLLDVKNLKKYSPLIAMIAFVGALDFMGIINTKEKAIEVASARAGSKAVDAFDGKNLEPFMKPGICPDNYPWGEPRQLDQDVKSRALYYCSVRYAAQYDPIYKVPLWTHEVVTKRDLEVPLLVPKLDRPVENDNFPTKIQPHLQDYLNSGYVPAFMASMDNMRIDDVNEMYETRKARSEKAIKDSAMMTNSVPMNQLVRDKIWLPLDNFVRQSAVNYHRVFVISGPLYLGNAKKGDMGESKVAIPTHFFKIITEPSQHMTMAYVIPNDDKQACPGGQCSLQRFGVTLQEIERLTGFEFYPNLSPYYAAQVRKDPNEVLRKKQQELQDKINNSGK